MCARDVCWYLYGVCPILSPPSNSSPAWHFMISCAKLQKKSNIRNFLPGQNSAGSLLRHIYPLFDVGFNVSTVLQHDVVWVQMFIMKANGYPVYRSRSPHLLTERYWLHQFCINFTHSRQLAAAGAYIAAFSIHLVIYVHWELWPPTGSHKPAKYGECDI